MKWYEIRTSKGQVADSRGFVLIGISVLLGILILVVRGWDIGLLYCIGGVFMGFAHVFYVAHLLLQEDEDRRG